MAADYIVAEQLEEYEQLRVARIDVLGHEDFFLCFKCC